MDLEEGIPLVVAISKLMLEEHLHIRAVRPPRGVTQILMQRVMIKTFIQKCNEGKGLLAPRIAVGIPREDHVERRAVREAGLAGAREVQLIDEPVTIEHHYQ